MKLYIQSPFPDEKKRGKQTQEGLGPGTPWGIKTICVLLVVRILVSDPEYESHEC